MGKLFCIAVLAAIVTSCASSPSQTMSPVEIAKDLGYQQLSTVGSVPALETFTLESVNSRTTVMSGGFGVKYLIIFGHNCPEAGFGNLFDTTSTGGQLDTEDSIIIDDEIYCRISELYVLE